MMKLQVKGGFITEQRTDYVFMNFSYGTITFTIILLFITLFLIS